MNPEKRRAGRAVRRHARRRRRYELLFKAMGVELLPWQLDWLLAEPLYPRRMWWEGRR